MTVPTPGDIADKLAGKPEADPAAPPADPQDAPAAPPADPADPPAEDPQDPPAAPSKDDDPAPDPAEDKDEPLRPEGEKALKAWKQRAREAEKALKELNDAKAKEDLTEQERAIADARAEAAAEAEQKASRRIVRAEAKALARDQTSDLSLLLEKLDLDNIELDNDGNVDEADLQAAIDAELAAHPVLAAQRSGGGSKVPAHAITPPKPPSLDDQIAKAEADGNWTQAAALKVQRL